MGKLHRIDQADTVDTAVRLLVGLQAEGWGVSTLEHHIDYQAPSHKDRAIPVEATVTIRLRPAR